MKLIGISGKARSGKDSIANILVMTHGFSRIAFADPVKLAAQQVFGLSDEQTWDDDLKEVVIEAWGMTPRKMFQSTGDAFKAAYNDEVWIKRFDMAYNLIADTDHVVVPDVRYDIEAAYVRNQGGIIIEVRRGIGLVGSAGDHGSEKGLSTLPDFVIDNNGTLDELAAKLQEILK